MLQKAIPLLPSINLRATIDFYETRLGFTGINMGNYAILKSGNAEIHFYLADKNNFNPASCIICSDNLEDLYTNFAAKDMLYPAGKIEDIKFGKREFSARDNNGNMIRFVKYDQ
jgi:catechol 2,3-dioxygenase-like lactoylglutathione lyase family enzyme